MYYTIYKITCKTTGKIYIGKHQTENVDDGYMGSGKLLIRAQKKHGLENFSKEILHVFQDEEEMNAKEAELVTEEFCLRDDTYNICPGGKGGWGYVNSSGKNGSKLGVEENLRRYNSDQEYRKKFQDIGRKSGLKLHQRVRNGEISPQIFATYGDKNPMFGKTHSEETRKLMSERIRKGKITVQCPYCNKIGEKGNMNRWHFDNCKNR